MANFEIGMSFKIVASDGTWTIGIIDGKPAEWSGNMIEPTDGMEYTQKTDESTFGVNSTDEYVVEEGEWIENRYNGPVGTELFPYHPDTIDEGLRFCMAWEPSDDYPNGFPQAYPVSFDGKELIFFPNRCGNCENNYSDRRHCPRFN